MYNINQAIKNDIAKQGVSFIPVLPSHDGDGNYVYTVGLYETYGLPEIISFGLPSSIFAAIIGELVYNYGDKQKKIEPYRKYDNLANLPMMFIHAEQGNEYMLILDNHYGAAENIPKLQLLWPDEKGVFPFETGYNEQYDDIQPFLGKIYVL